MAFFTLAHLALIFGLLGNIVSFLVFLSPLPTFYTICKKKSSEGYQSIPYSVALMSAMLLLYYGLLKTNATLIVSINAIGCVIEVTYLTLYLIFAPRKERMFTIKLIGIMNIGATGLMMIATILLVKGSRRVAAVGFLCAAFNIAVFAAPLSIMRRVIKTRSVEYMPFSLSFFLTLCATVWFFYGLFVKDYFIALPNVLGFVLGISQIILYMIYKNAKKGDQREPKQHELEIVDGATKNEEAGSKVDEIKFVCDCKHIKSNENNI